MGNPLNESDWLNSLIGAQGNAGSNGDKGDQGDAGSNGAKGDTGAQGPCWSTR